MIKLSRLTDYAVVVLATMAQQQGVLMPASALSDKTGLGEPTVSKILKLLAKGGLVSSVRGVNGGYKLEHGAEAISVRDIITTMEGPIALTACTVGSEDSCALENVCCLKGRWNPVNEAIKDALERLSLADIAAVSPSAPVNQTEEIRL